MAATPVPARAHPAPTNLMGAPPATTTRVDVIAVTRDDALLEQLGREFDGQAGVQLADSVDAAGEHVDAARAQVILLDAREYTDLGSAVDRLQSLADTVVVVVFTPDPGSPDIATAMKRSAVFAVLPIPVETGKTAAVLDGAREEALTRATLSAPTVAPRPKAGHAIAAQPADPAPWAEPVAVATPAGPRAPRWLVPGVVGLVVLCAAVAWLLLDRPGQGTVPSPGRAATVASPEPPAAASVPERIEQGSIEDLLDKAATAFQERRYVEPMSDSALLYYRSVLAQAPDNGEAREGLDRVAAVLDTRLQSALAERRFEDAATAAAQLALVRPGDQTVKASATRIIEAQITAALDAGRADRATLLLRQATLAQALPGDRAAYWRDEINRRQGGRQAAGAQRQAAEAERGLTDARAPGAATPTPLSAAQVATAAGDQTATPLPVSEAERLNRLVQQRINEGRLVDPAQDSAVFYYSALRAADPSGAGTADQARTLSSQLIERAGSALAVGEIESSGRYLAAARQVGLEPARVEELERRLAAARQPAPPSPLKSAALERIYYVAPAYPKEALRKQLSGEVQLRITVDATGRVKAAEIVSSTPPGVFDQSVMAAVARWRFKAPQVDGRAGEATTVIAVVFKPFDGAQR